MSVVNTLNLALFLPDKKLPIETVISPKRPGYGTKGRDISLQANFFELKLPKGDIHHYDVTITPDKCPRAVNHAVVQTMVDQYHRMFGGQKPVYDGRKNLYSRSPLPIDKEKVGSCSIIYIYYLYKRIQFQYCM